VLLNRFSGIAEHRGVDARMAKKDLDGIQTELELLNEKLEKLEDLDMRTEKIVEEKVFEIKAVSYLTLIITAILLFLALGIITKTLGF
jgi:hypothetical protein